MNCDPAAIEVLAPGPLSSLQDQGRPGWRHLGVAHSGALDPGLAALANRLVGNDENQAVLEMCLHGPHLRLLRPLRLAWLGAALDLRFDARPLPATMGRPIELPPGELRLGGLRGGVRAWLAVAGGFAAPPVLGSRSTDLRGGFGGYAGRALQVGDRLTLGEQCGPATEAPRWSRWWIDPEFDPPTQAPIRYRALPAPALAEAQARFAAQAWSVAAASDRQGLRLAGASLPAPAAAGVSEPVAPGTVQLPPDGQPIVLLADAQTVGGYARLGHVIAADLPRLAQAAPNAPLRFRACDAAEAAAAWRERQQRLARLRVAVDARLRD
ncbi:biotin-dependent carboxyltransferase family protein [Lysobacter firmicutimachus]|uniref:Biotin-dependent carboxyltransferase family protein n=1 Tax=Lysobacter firmicutimachus TaxID=1792846 RepID=A0AAU8MSM2_9GAMM